MFSTILKTTPKIACFSGFLDYKDYFHCNVLSDLLNFSGTTGLTMQMNRLPCFNDHYESVFLKIVNFTGLHVLLNFSTFGRVNLKNNPIFGIYIKFATG